MSRLPKPYYRPSALNTIYRKVTGEDIAEEFLREILRTEDDRRLMILSLVKAGYSPAQISGALDITRQGVENCIARTMRAAWKVYRGKPRYHLKGRRKNEK